MILCRIFGHVVDHRLVPQRYRNGLVGQRCRRCYTWLWRRPS